MADRAEMFSLSTFHSLSPPGCRAPQDISLEEFDDEDLSEITDDCGIGLNYDSDHYEKDCLVLERCEQPQTICSFQDDFQEFEMIDDNEDEEEEEGTGLEERPPSPSVSPIPSPTPGETQKPRPTTLHLTTTGTQDSLNNNSSCNPAPVQQRATWQETLRLASPSSSSSSSAACAERSSPSHPCLQDGPCREAANSQGSDPTQPPCKPGLYDAEGNSRRLPGGPPPARPGEDYNKNLVASLLSRSPAPCPAPAEPPRGPEPPPPPGAGPAADSARSPRQAAGCGAGEAARAGGRGSPAPSEEEERAEDRRPAPASPAGERAAEGVRGSRASSVGSARPSASSATTSPSSDPGIEADLSSREGGKAFGAGGRRGQALLLISSPGSDSEAEGELEAAFLAGGGPRRAGGNMISSISETELDLSSASSTSSGRSSHLTNSIEEASSPGSEADLDADLDPPPPPPPPGLKGALLLQASAPPPRRRRELDDDDDDDPSAPVHHAGAPPSLHLEIDPDHSRESLRRSFYLPVGPRLLPGGEDDEDEEDDEEGGADSEDDSESGSGSESEADLSEDSDSPWLLSNLVNKMISEGSYPIRCAEEEEEEGFPAAAAPAAAHSLADTLSPASDLESELPADEAPSRPPAPPRSIELVDMETLRSSLQQSAHQERPPPPPPPPPAPFLLLSNPTDDTIAPLGPGRPLAACCALDGAPGSQGLLDDRDLIDDVRLEPLHASTARTNRGFCWAPSPDAGPEEDAGEEGQGRPPAAPLDESLAYDAVKYTLVVDEHTQLELVSLKRCTALLSDEDDEDGQLRPPRRPRRAPHAAGSDFDEDEDEEEDDECGLAGPDGRSSSSSSEDSSPEADLHFSKKFLNVFVNSTSRSSSTESFGLFSCMVNGEEREQTHRAVFRFIPRHEDELELDVDDPILVELEEDDYWYRGYNMRTGERGIFPAFYAHEVVSPAKEVGGLKRNPCWVERFNVQFLGSVEVPYHQGNGILCAAMQKIATTRKLTVHLRPPATCDLEISLQGIKLILSVNEYSRDEEFERCSHFFQMKNISFCGCHPRNSCYFGFITKHPVLSRFACHVFVSQESMRHVAECVGRAFQEYYQEHLEFACPTEDIYLE